MEIRRIDTGAPVFDILITFNATSGNFCSNRSPTSTSGTNQNYLIEELYLVIGSHFQKQIDSNAHSVSGSHNKWKLVVYDTAKQKVCGEHCES